MPSAIPSVGLDSGCAGVSPLARETEPPRPRAAAGKNAVMPVIVREKAKGYKWRIGEAPLSRVANVEKKMPRRFISKDGLPIYASLKKQRVKKTPGF